MFKPFVLFVASLLVGGGLIYAVLKQRQISRRRERSRRRSEAARQNNWLWQNKMSRHGAQQITFQPGDNQTTDAD
jgi:hypothetical protein